MGDASHILRYTNPLNLQAQAIRKEERNKEERSSFYLKAPNKCDGNIKKEK